MEKASAARSNHSTPPSISGEAGSKPLAEKASNQRTIFLSMALAMSWQLMVAVLVPVIGGVFLDKAFHTAPVFLIAGLVLAVIATIIVLWRTLQTANKLPVPQLTDAERRAIAKSYEEDDEE